MSNKFVQYCIAGDILGLKQYCESNTSNRNQCNLKDDRDYGRCPLIKICCIRRPELKEEHIFIIQYLLGELSCDPNIHDSYGRMTPLMYCCVNGHTDIIPLLLQKGAIVDIRNEDGWTPFLFASKQGNPYIMSILIQAGASVDLQNKDGMAALLFAACNGRASAIPLLVEAGANVDIKDQYGMTGLMFATMNGHHDTVPLIIQAGCDIDIQDLYGFTALIYASWKGHAECLNVLLDAGARLDLQDEAGKTALDLAQTVEIKEIIKNHQKKSSLLRRHCEENERDIEDSNSLMMVDEVGSLAAAHTANLENNNFSALDSTEKQEKIKIFRSLDLEKQAWLRSKISLVGEGGAGKTALSLALIGRPQPSCGVKSTRGMNVFDINILLAGIQAGRWLDIPKTGAGEHVREHEKALTRAYLQRLKENKLAAASGSRDLGKPELIATGVSASNYCNSYSSVSNRNLSNSRSGLPSLAENAISGSISSSSISSSSSSSSSSTEMFVENSIISDNNNNSSYSNNSKKRQAPLALTGKDLLEGDKDEEKVVELPKKGRIDTTDRIVSDSSGQSTSLVVNMDSQPKSQSNLSSSSSSSSSSSAAGGGSCSINSDSNSSSNKSTNSISDETIMKCLSDNIQSSSKFLISLFDFGGQKVFNVMHPFFLTRYGVYILVFNMEEFLSSDLHVKTQCLSNISLWINSIVMHTLSIVKTLDGDNNLVTAPVAFVGTRKDKISKSSDHELISRLLDEHFSESLVFKNLIKNNDADGMKRKFTLNFFPVNCLVGRADSTTVTLLRLIEQRIDASDYVHEEKPLNWLKTLDDLNLTKKDYLQYEEVVEIALMHQVEVDEVPDLLRFLHEMGMLMWLEDASLRDIVIMNPVKFFIEPATTIICSHTQTKDDSTTHVLPIVESAKLDHFEEYNDMVKKGTVSEKLLHYLLVDTGINRDYIISLMLKFGLMSKVNQVKQIKLQKYEEVSYVVPALLPLYQIMSDNEINSAITIPWPKDSYSTFYFCFSTSDYLEKHQRIFSWKDLRSKGFLPNGLFERFICKAVSHSQKTQIDSINLSLIFKNFAMLSYGKQMFQIRNLAQNNCIRVDVEGRYPVAIFRRLLDQLQALIEECMKSLNCFPTLLIGDRTADEYQTLEGDSKHILLDEAYGIISESRSVFIGNYTFTALDLKQKYPIWFATGMTNLKEYDIFLSYRWSNYDSSLVQTIFDRLTLYVVDDVLKRSIDTFLDLKRLRKGVHLHENFSKALINTSEIVPVVSRSALERLTSSKFNPDCEDNVLIEWILSLECFHYRKNSPESTRVVNIFPVFIGQNVNGKISNLFDDKVFLDEISTSIPTKSISIAAALLKQNNIIVDEERLYKYTVKGIMQQLFSFNGLCAWNFDFDCLHASVTKEVRESLDSCINDQKQIVDISPRSDSNNNNNSISSSNNRSISASAGSAGDESHSMAIDNSSKVSLVAQAVLAIDTQSGWGDENKRYSLDMSRFELYSQILSLQDSSGITPNSLTAIDLKVFDVNLARYDDIRIDLKESGVVKLRGVFKDNMFEVASYRSASERALEMVEKLSWDEHARETKDLQGAEESLGLTVCTRHCKGRYDLYPADSMFLIPHLKTRFPIVERLLGDCMGSAGFIVNSTGYIPVLPSTAAGEWHRDIRSMFTWPDAQGSADASDKMDCTRLPDFYYTLFIMLHDSPPMRGGAETEFILGSHQLSVSESLSSLRILDRSNITLACNFEYKAGDIILMNGKMLHRGRENKLPDFIRHCIYVVYTAPWYSSHV